MKAQDEARQDCMNEEPFLGRIEVSPRAISSIAGQAVLECYGVVGMAAKHARMDLGDILPGAHFRHGVQVHLNENRIVIDLYVVIESGTRITQVAQGIQKRVAFSVEHATGLQVAEVNVHVQDLRVSPGT